MIRSIRVMVLVSAVLAASGACAQTADTIASSIPPSVTEVSTGGAWSKNGETGAFRAIVVTNPAASAPVSVYVQLLAFGKDGAGASVVKSIPIKEVVERKLKNAFVNFDAEAENKVMLIITSYDPEKDTDKSIYAEVTVDGAYKLIDAPKDNAGAAAKK